MEKESFEDRDVAAKLANAFISIKVDKEERPDIDSIYMNACQSMGGNGGWPLTVIMTHEQKPFFTGTYFPKHSRYGHIGLMELLEAVEEKWKTNKSGIMQSCEQITEFLKNGRAVKANSEHGEPAEKAASMLKNSFDREYGGFGDAPKFPAAHNLLFLMRYAKAVDDHEALAMAEKTLSQMYLGGIFDHIGYGFSRYSTDKYWLAPHFEKMLYDNALLIMAYVEAYKITKNEVYKTVAQKTMTYVLRELTDEDGGFYCAQDADSDGVEGKYYVFTPDEIISVLGEKDGGQFNRFFGITREGNFEGKNIPNLIHHLKPPDNAVNHMIPAIYKYRKSRTRLHLDDKILTSWNSLMIAAFASAYRVLREEVYLNAAKSACEFIDTHLSDNDCLYASYRDGKKSRQGFIDDYAFYIFAQIAMYEATLERAYLDKAVSLNKKVTSDFSDGENGGYYLYGIDGERLIFRPKETYDGAMPSGNSVMAYNLVKLYALTGDDEIRRLSDKQNGFMSAQSAHYPAAYCFFMMSLLAREGKKIVCVLKDLGELPELRKCFPLDASIVILEEETAEYKRKDNRTTFYVCENNSCLPPVNELPEQASIRK